MDVCRVCLSVGPDKHIYQLTLSHEDCTVEYPEIIGLCFSNEYLEHKMKVDGLCTECYHEILRFYKFKSKALKNDAYIRSIEPDIVEMKKDTEENKNPLIENDELSEEKVNILQNDEGQSIILCQIDENEIKYEYTVDDFKNEDELDMPNTDETALDMENSAHSDDEESSTPASPADTNSDTSEESSDDNDSVPTHRPVDSDPEPDFDPTKNDSLKLKPKPVKKIKRTMPLTSAQRQKRYKERLKAQNPEKYEEMRVKYLENVKQKRVSEMTDEEKTLQRQKLKKAKENRTRKITGDVEPQNVDSDPDPDLDPTKKDSLKLKRKPKSVKKIKDAYEQSVKPRTCQYCHEMFSDALALRKHRRKIHYNVKDVCHICRKEVTKDSLKFHIIRAHEPEKLKECKICRKKFIVQSNLEQHECKGRRIRKKPDKPAVRPHGCTLCDKRYTTPQLLQYHIRNKHENKYNYLCQYCSKGFAKIWDMRRHIRIHTKEKPFKCDDCGAAFSTPHQVKFHQHSHKTDRQYQCHICLKLYKNPQYVATHFQKHHTGQCRYCSEQFTTPDDRRAHEKKTHTNETPFGLINNSTPARRNEGLAPVRAAAAKAGRSATKKPKLRK